MTTAAALDVRLRHAFPDFSLDVRFTLDRHIGVLFGPSGAGKTLALRLIAGLLQPQEGLVRLGDRVLFRSDREPACIPPQRRRIGYVFQHHALFPHMTVLENIVYGARGVPKEHACEEAHRLLKQFRIEAAANKFPKGISGGQRQRVAFARALIAKPELLLLDEPFSALDAPTRLHMRECLVDVMRALGIPVLMITHDLGEALPLADRMFVCLNGRIVQEGRPADIRSTPASNEVAELMASL